MEGSTVIVLHHETTGISNDLKIGFFRLFSRYMVGLIVSNGRK